MIAMLVLFSTSPPTFSTTYLQKLTTYRKRVDLALPFC